MARARRFPGIGDPVPAVVQGRADIPADAEAAVRPRSRLGSHAGGGND